MTATLDTIKPVHNSQFFIENVEGNKYTLKTINNKYWCAQADKKSILADRDAPQSWEHWTVRKSIHNLNNYFFKKTF